MHGSIYVLLKKFVEQSFDTATWETLLADVGLPGQQWDAATNYGDEAIGALVQAAASRLQLTPADVLQTFGEYIVPDIMATFGRYADPSWRTFDTIANTERALHYGARTDFPGIQPPVLNVTIQNANQLTIDYYSKRRMAALAVGIIKGIAKYHGEADAIQVTPTTTLEAERVQIKVSRIVL